MYPQRTTTDCSRHYLFTLLHTCDLLTLISSNLLKSRLKAMQLEAPLRSISRRETMLQVNSEKKPPIHANHSIRSIKQLASACFKALTLIRYTHIIDKGIYMHFRWAVDTLLWREIFFLWVLHRFSINSSHRLSSFSSPESQLLANSTARQSYQVIACSNQQRQTVLTPQYQ